MCGHVFKLARDIDHCMCVCVLACYIAAPARRSVRTQPPRKSTSRSTTVTQPPPSLQHDTHSTAEDDDDDEELDQEESSDGGSVTRCLCGEQRKLYQWCWVYVLSSNAWHSSGTHMQIMSV